MRKMNQLANIQPGGRPVDSKQPMTIQDSDLADEYLQEWGNSVRFLVYEALQTSHEAELTEWTPGIATFFHYLRNFQKPWFHLLADAEATANFVSYGRGHLNKAKEFIKKTNKLQLDASDDTHTTDPAPSGPLRLPKSFDEYAESVENFLCGVYDVVKVYYTISGNDSVSQIPMDQTELLGSRIITEDQLQSNGFISDDLRKSRLDEFKKIQTNMDDTTKDIDTPTTKSDVPVKKMVALCRASIAGELA